MTLHIGKIISCLLLDLCVQKTYHTHDQYFRKLKTSLFRWGEISHL